VNGGHIDPASTFESKIVNTYHHLLECLSLSRYPMKHLDTSPGPDPTYDGIDDNVVLSFGDLEHLSGASEYLADVLDSHLGSFTFGETNVIVDLQPGDRIID